MKKNALIPCFGLLAAFAMAFIFTACENPTSNTKVMTGTVAIQKDGLTVTEAEMGVELKAVVKGSKGTALRYQWQKRTGSGAFANIPGATLAVYKVAAPVAAGDVIKVVVSATGFAGKKQSATVLVKPSSGPDLAGVVIHKDDAPVAEVALGDTVKAVLTGLNVGEGSLYQYQWQKRKTGDDVYDVFTNIPDATSETYEVADPVVVTDEIRVVVTADVFFKKMESNGIPVVNPDDPLLTGSVTIARDPAGTPVRIGDTVKATPDGLNDGAVPIYQWQKKTGNGEFADIPDSTSSETYRIATPVVANDKIRVVIHAANFRDTKASNEISVEASLPAVISGIVITHEASEIIPFDPETFTKVGKGRTLQFFAEVSGQNLTVEDEEVIWSVAGTGPTASGTGIDADGLLTAGLAESNTILTVTATSKTDPEVTKTMDVTVVAVFTVTFDPDGGTPVQALVPDVFSGNVAVVEAGKTMNLTVGSIGWVYITEKEDDSSLFNGWYDIAGSYQTAIYSIPSISRNYTLKPIWRTPFWVTLNLDGGKLVDHVTGEDLPTRYPILPGGTFAPHAYVPTKNGVVFYGWYLSTDPDKKVITGPLTGINAGNTTMPITADTTFVAKWGQGIEFTFDPNGGTFPSGVQTVYHFAPRYKVFLELYPDPAPPAGKAFRGWARSTNLTYVYGKFDIIQMPAEESAPSITLVAQWAEEIVITLNLNGGEFPIPVIGDPIQTTYVRAPGTTFNVPSTYPVREDYSFSGWFLDAELTEVFPEIGGITVGNDPITIYVGWIDLRNLGVYKATNGDAVIIEKTNAGLFIGTFTRSSCGVFRFEGAGFLTVIDVDTIRVRAPNSSFTTTFTRVTEKKQPAATSIAALKARWKQPTDLGGTIIINLTMDWDTGGGAAFIWEDPEWNSISFPVCYVVENDTLYLVRQYGQEGARLPGEVIWNIPIVNNALQGWTK